MAVCEYCGKSFKPRHHGGSKQKYCSAGCRRKAWEKNKKSGKPTKSKTTDDAPRRAGKRIVVPVSPHAAASMDRRQFEAMMDEPYEELLRFSRDVLKNAMSNPDTPASALAPLSRELLDVGRQLGESDNHSVDAIIGGETSDSQDESFQAAAL